MTQLFTSNRIGTWPPEEPRQQDSSGSLLEAQAIADHEVSEEGVEIADHSIIRNSALLSFLMKTLVVLIVLTLSAVSGSVRGQHDAELTHGSSNVSSDSGSDKPDGTVSSVKVDTHLARVTVYWPEEGDYYTKRRRSSTGVSLRDGHCAVDPKVIPYGSVVKVPGMGEFVAVDTGSAVVSRRAARAAGRTSHERNALVVDVYCSTRSKARAFEASAPKFAVVSWYQ